MHKLPRLYQSRHGVYYLRIIRNKVKTRLSLGTKDFRIARLLALRANMELAMSNRDFDLDAIRRLGVEISPTGEVKFTEVKADDLDTISAVLDRLGLREKYAQEAINSVLAQSARASSSGSLPVGMPRGERVTPKSKPFSEVVELYLVEKKLDNVPKTLYDKERIYTEFQGFYGDHDINQYTANEAVSYKNRLLAEGSSASQINARLSFMRSLFEYAVGNNLYFAPNPFEKVKVSNKSKLKQQVRSYKELTTEDLQTIFNEPAYRKFMRSPDYYWLPFIALYTGARENELASLTFHHIYQHEGIWVIDLTAEIAKNKNSVRMIPLHNVILESKFLDYVEQTKATRKDGYEMIFFPKKLPTEGGKNGFGKNISRRFGDYLDQLKITDDRKTFHSFRSTFINEMTNLNVHPAIIMGIVGHYEQSKVDLSSPHFVNYQKKKPIHILKEAIDKLAYPVKSWH
ncbi:site-specific integrase [Ralstonia solanacearum]|uniref:site-specific integrase n=1 Tax=Ralstonia solanacearum TaxID=305 RepID=UPI0005ACBB49|nr:site-specific integrase [Ralstonia solanacearum]AMP74838.1 integrase [Ralstonia solanacearum]MCL9828042.1 site-specific integrase [Ralstonia solanacearum]MCL9832810.1 site-specific integrase [Ralstonia solanacearum]MCL9837591.1 site-specific integrase [Ralstonia solanacearum]OAI70679.1 integrase [Ralstonia solanacearum]